MTETTTPSVERDRLEAIARIIAFGAVTNVEGHVLNSEPLAALIVGLDCPALPCKGGEADYNARELLAEEYERGGEYGPYPSYAALARKAEGAFTLCSIRAIERALATPTTEPDTGRGLREALEEIARMTPNSANAATIAKRALRISRQALAALSDTPRGREEEGKQGLMASRDLGPTTVASSLKGSDVGEVKP